MPIIWRSNSKWAKAHTVGKLTCEHCTMTAIHVCARFDLDSWYSSAWYRQMDLMILHHISSRLIQFTNTVTPNGSYDLAPHQTEIGTFHHWSTTWVVSMTGTTLNWDLCDSLAWYRSSGSFDLAPYLIEVGTIYQFDPTNLVTWHGDFTSHQIRLEIHTICRFGTVTSGCLAC